MRVKCQLIDARLNAPTVRFPSDVRSPRVRDVAATNEQPTLRHPQAFGSFIRPVLGLLSMGHTRSEMREAHRPRRFALRYESRCVACCIGCAILS